MTPGIDVFLEHGIQEYAQDRVRAGFWTETESLARSRKEHRATLPDGIKSRYHHFYTIRDSETGNAVGILWLKTDLDSSRGSGFIFDLEIHEPFRRKGYARQAMLELENVARGMGLRNWVFTCSPSMKGRACLRGLGYSVAWVNMLKGSVSVLQDPCGYLRSGGFAASFVSPTLERARLTACGRVPVSTSRSRAPAGAALQCTAAVRSQLHARPRRARRA
jgi:GNAT superfamily N-acetyltransferase